MKRFRNTNPCLLLALLLGFTLITEASSAHEKSSEKKLPAAMVVGTVFCDTCSKQSISETSHFISGASVAVECKDGGSRIYQEGQTNEHGEFKVRLPISVAKSLKKSKACSVELVSSSEPLCAVISTKKTTSSPLRLKGRNEETHIFSAGLFAFKPLKQPDLCQKKRNPKSSQTQIHQENPKNTIKTIQEEQYSPRKQVIGSVLPPFPSILPPLPFATPPPQPPIFGVLPPVPGIIPGLPLVNPIAPAAGLPPILPVPVPRIPGLPVIGDPPLSASSSSADKP